MLVITNKLIVKTENKRKEEPSIAACVIAPSVIASSPINKAIKNSPATPLKINIRNLSRTASQIENFAIVRNRL